MTKKALLILLASLVVLGLMVAILGRPNPRKVREWREFTAAANSLVGQKQATADRVMSSLGMRFRQDQNHLEWRLLIDHVSPTPPKKPGLLARKYTDEGRLNKKCAFIYVDGRGVVKYVHTAVDHW
jgi:hypothetical protein